MPGRTRNITFPLMPLAVNALTALENAGKSAPWDPIKYVPCSACVNASWQPSITSIAHKKNLLFRNKVLNIAFWGYCLKQDLQAGIIAFLH
jgi:hypothetical protein